VFTGTPVIAPTFSNIQKRDHTGIELTPSESFSNGQKILRDGQILILRGEKVYNVQGQEVR
jgi:hypothetical protein